MAVFQLDFALDCVIELESGNKVFKGLSFISVPMAQCFHSSIPIQAHYGVMSHQVGSVVDGTFCLVSKVVVRPNLVLISY